MRRSFHPDMTLSLSSCPQPGPLREAPSTSNGEPRMEKIETHQLLSIRLGAIHGLLVDMLEVFLGWIIDGGAKRFALEHESEQIIFSDMEPFYQLLSLVQNFGDTLAWLENPHLKPLPALEEMYCLDCARDDNPAVNSPAMPSTGIEFLDTLLYLVSMITQLDSFAEKLMSDSEKGRFKDTSAYSAKDVPILNAELLVHAADIKEQFHAVLKIMVPDSGTDLGTEMKDFVENRLKLQEDELTRLLAFMPGELGVESIESRKLGEERKKEFFASWHGAKPEIPQVEHLSS